MGTQEGSNRIQSLGMLYELSWIIDNCKRHQKIDIQKLYDIIEKLKALIIVQAYQISKRLNRPMVTEKRLGNIDNLLKSGSSGNTNPKTSLIKDPSILKPIKEQNIKNKDHFIITSSDTILIKSLKGAINYIIRMDDEKIFENRVNDSIAPGYSNFIKNPMEISTIKKKLLQYNSLDDLNNDIVLMFENCIHYNGLDNYYGMKANEYINKWNMKLKKEKVALSLLNNNNNNNNNDNNNDSNSIITLQECLEESLKYVTSLDRNRFFATKVTDEIAPGYSNEIHNPMDFGLIKRKFNNYNSFDSFDKDVLLVYNNCIQFNGIESVLGSIASDHKIKWQTKKENLMKRLVIDTTVPIEPLSMLMTTDEKLSKNKDYGDDDTNDNQSIKSNLNEKKATSKISFSKGLDEALNFLIAIDTSQVFATRVTDDVAPGYSQIIKNPMDLSKIKKKLNRYSSLDEFDSDVILMFDNCTRYNGKGSEYSNLAIDLKAKWNKMKDSLKNRINYELNDQAAVIISSQGSSDAPKIKLVLTIKKDIPPPPALKETKVLAVIPTKPIRNKELPEATTTFSIQADMTKKQATRSAIEFSWFYLVDLDDKGFFSCPVIDSIAPGYSKVIENPMDLSVIRVKIDRKAYKTMEIFDNDVQLMLRNCFIYNNDMSQIYIDTLAFKDTWDAQLIAIKKVLGPHAVDNDKGSAAPSSGPAKKRMRYGNIVEPVKMEVSESLAHSITEPLPLQTAAVQPSIESNVTITQVPMEVDSEPVPSSTEAKEKESHVLKPSIVDDKKNNDKEAPKNAKIVINPTKVKENDQDPSTRKEDNKEKDELDDFLYHNSIDAAKVIQNRSKPFERFPEVLTETKLMWAICMLRDSAVQNLFIESLGLHLASLEGKVIIQPGSKKSYRDFTLPSNDIASKLLLQMCQLSLSNDLNIHALDEELIRVYIPLIMLNIAQAKDEANENDEQIIVAEKSKQIVNSVLSNEGKLNNNKKKLLLVITKILLM